MAFMCPGCKNWREPYRLTGLCEGCYQTYREREMAVAPPRGITVRQTTPQPATKPPAPPRRRAVVNPPLLLASAEAVEEPAPPPSLARPVKQYVPVPPPPPRDYHNADGYIPGMSRDARRRVAMAREMARQHRLHDGVPEGSPGL